MQQRNNLLDKIIEDFKLHPNQLIINNVNLTVGIVEVEHAEDQVGLTGATMGEIDSFFYKEFNPDYSLI